MSKLDVDENNLFGTYLKLKRIQKDFSLRELAKLLDIGHTYLLNIENGNRPPPNDEMLKQMAKSLSLDESERQLFFDLAVKSKQIRNNKNYYLPVDVSEYISKTYSVKKAIRTANSLGCSDEFWNEFLKKLK